MQGVPNGTYYVRVRATNADGASGPSSEVTVTVPVPCALPGAPTGLAGTVNGTAVTLSWTAPASACPITGYIVQAGSAPGLSNLAAVAVPSAGLTASAPPGAYFVRVVAVNAGGAGPPSADVLITVGTTCVAPGSPTGLGGAVAGLSVSLTWTPPASGGAPSLYLLEAGSAPALANLAVLPLVATSYSTAAPAGTYYVRVRAQNACGTSTPSNEVIVTLAAGPAGGMVISEFRTRGPAGANDEFIEIRNGSGAAVDIGGWQVSGSNATGTTQVRATVPGGVVLPAGCYYLLTNSNSGGPYSGTVAGDLTYGVGIADDGGIALLDATSAVVDAVGLSAGSAYGEGSRLGSFGTANSDRSLVRSADTNNNAADFANRAPGVPQNAAGACSAAPRPFDSAGAIAHEP